MMMESLISAGVALGLPLGEKVIRKIGPSHLAILKPAIKLAMKFIDAEVIAENIDIRKLASEVLGSMPKFREDSEEINKYLLEFQDVLPEVTVFVSEVTNKLIERYDALKENFSKFEVPFSANLILKETGTEIYIKVGKDINIEVGISPDADITVTLSMGSLLEIADALNTSMMDAINLFLKEDFTFNSAQAISKVHQFLYYLLDPIQDVSGIPIG
jgi:hypothetical protein